MDAFISIQIRAPERIEYTLPLASWSKANFPGLLMLDFDNESEKFHVDKIQEQALKAWKLILFILADEGVAAGKLVPFLNGISRKRNQETLIIMEGGNILIEKMSRVIAPGNFIHNRDPEHQKNAVSLFIGKV